MTHIGSSAMGTKATFGSILVVVCVIGLTSCSYPEQGKWDVSLNRVSPPVSYFIIRHMTLISREFLMYL